MFNLTKPQPNPFAQAPPVIDNTGKIVVMVPVAHHIEPQTDQALRDLEKRGITVKRKWGFSCISQGRCAMATESLDEGYEWLIWLDSDLDFWSWDIEKIVSHGLPVVGGAYSVKGWPVLTTEFLEDGEVILGVGGGLKEVRFIATGFLCVHRSVYEKLAETMLRAKIWGGQYNSYPFYLPEVVDVDGDRHIIGEDFNFIRKVRGAGFKVYCDTSLQIGHIGKYAYGYEFLGRGVASEPKSIIYRQTKSNY